MTYTRRSVPKGRILSDKKAYYRKLGPHMYQLSRDFLVQTNIYPERDISTDFLTLTVDGVLCMFSGYVNDGPSGPTIDTKSAMRFAFSHDALYRFMRRSLLGLQWRKSADLLVKSLGKEDKMYEWRRNLWYKLLRAVGAKNAKPKNARPIIVAPGD